MAVFIKPELFRELDPDDDEDDENDEAPPPPPPASQSHFAKFDNFTPDDAAPFEAEFSRLASSQEWVPGSQEYTRQRTIAMREEVQLLFFSQPQPKLERVDEEGEDDEVRELSIQEVELLGYQALCREVGIDPSDDVEVCKKMLKSTLVNIVDLIDTRRTGKKVEVWHDFEKFRAYTLKRRISLPEAKEHPGYLASLLQYLRGPGPRPRRNKKRSGNRVVSGRITKAEA